MAHSRISITLPRDVLVAADKRARELDRSRSWLLVEAVRAYLTADPAQLREPAPAPYAVTPGLGPQRLAQLQSDLRLTPERRVRAAEETARLGERVRGARPPANRVISFDRYDDYLEWRRKESISS
jgi:hypothetical protein